MKQKHKKDSGKTPSQTKLTKTTYARDDMPSTPETPFSPEGHAGKIQGPGPVTAHGHKSIIGLYGRWAAGLLPDPPELSFRRQIFQNVTSWKTEALTKASTCLASPETGGLPAVSQTGTYEYDGLHIEELEWQLPYGHPTKAVFLKPSGATGKLPGILALHDHGGNKYFGLRKITKTSDHIHPLIENHQKTYYGKRAWANEIAKKGYAVLVHDAFGFASRRLLPEDMTPIPWGPGQTTGLPGGDPEDPSDIEMYNLWAAGHEHIMSKSLFCAGTTWPGVFLAEDQRALDVLCDRSDVDAERIGCAGLSGGGLRTVFLGGLDPRIKCAVAAGFMTTWRDFVLNKSYTHTWMAFVPLLPKYLDFPEILGLRLPLPTMVMNNVEDELYTLSEMERADKILEEIFRKASASERYTCHFYAGYHKFDTKMQEDAFNWLDKWLKI